MELRIILSENEQALLGLEEAEFPESDAIHLLFDATQLLARNTEHLNNLRGHTPGVRGQLNVTWHQNSVLSDLVQGLERVTGTGSESTL